MRNNLFIYFQCGKVSMNRSNLRAFFLISFCQISCNSPKPLYYHIPLLIKFMQNSCTLRPCSFLVHYPFIPTSLCGFSQSISFQQKISCIQKCCYKISTIYKGLNFGHRIFSSELQKKAF